MIKNNFFKTTDKLILGISIYNILSFFIMLPLFLIFAFPIYISNQNVNFSIIIFAGYIIMLFGSLLLVRSSRIGWSLTLVAFLIQAVTFNGYYLRLNPIHLTPQLNIAGFEFGVDIPSLILIIILLSKAHLFFPKKVAT